MPKIGLYLMSAVYVLAGIVHFIRPEMYKNIIPPYLPQPLLLVYVSGVMEILLGVLLLFKPLQVYAAWAIILMLIAFLSVHIYMLQADKFDNMSRFLLWSRLPLQLALIYWAYRYT